MHAIIAIVFMFLERIRVTIQITGKCVVMVETRILVTIEQIIIDNQIQLNSYYQCEFITSHAVFDLP